MKTISYFFLFVFALTTNNIFSQISGISASKLVVINAETVPESKIEFEPSFGFSVSVEDSLQISSDFGFRFTYGLNSKTEVGISLPVNMSGINWGLKYNAVNYNNLSVGIIAGIENALIVNNSNEPKYGTFFKSYAAGLVSTYQINKKLSIDFDTQIQNKFHYSKQDFHWFFNSEIGYYIPSGLQFVTGIQYEYKPFHENEKYNFIINNGITVEKAENFILVLNFPYQFKTKNTPSSVGFATALTILID